MWPVLEGEAITPEVFGADFLSPFAGAGAGGATLCKHSQKEKRHSYDVKYKIRTVLC